MNNNTYYQSEKERLLEKARMRYHQQGGMEKANQYYQNNKGKGIKTEYGRNQYRNMSEQEKQTLKEYHKNDCNLEGSVYYVFAGLFKTKREQL